jgi:hypothetical protein
VPPNNPGHTTTPRTVKTALTISQSHGLPHQGLSLPAATTYRGTCDRTMIRGSVISSMANRRPSRPNPESLEPPYGI